MSSVLEIPHPAPITALAWYRVEYHEELRLNRARLDLLCEVMAQFKKMSTEAFQGWLSGEIASLKARR